MENEQKLFMEERASQILSERILKNPNEWNRFVKLSCNLTSYPLAGQINIYDQTPRGYSSSTKYTTKAYWEKMGGTLNISALPILTIQDEKVEEVYGDKDVDLSKANIKALNNWNIDNVRDMTVFLQHIIENSGLNIKEAATNNLGSIIKLISSNCVNNAYKKIVDADENIFSDENFKSEIAPIIIDSISFAIMYRLHPGNKDMSLDISEDRLNKVNTLDTNFDVFERVYEHSLKDITHIFNAAIHFDHINNTKEMIEQQQEAVNKDENLKEESTDTLIQNTEENKVLDSKEFDEDQIQNEQVKSPKVDSDDRSAAYTIEQSKHTKTGADIWLVHLNKPLTKSEYQEVKDVVREHKGYYYKKVHAFVLSEDPANWIKNLEMPGKPLCMDIDEIKKVDTKDFNEDSDNVASAKPMYDFSEDPGEKESGYQYTLLDYFFPSVSKNVSKQNNTVAQDNSVKNIKEDIDVKDNEHIDDVVEQNEIIQGKNNQNKNQVSILDIAHIEKKKDKEFNVDLLHVDYKPITASNEAEYVPGIPNDIIRKFLSIGGQSSLYYDVTDMLIQMIIDPDRDITDLMRRSYAGNKHREYCHGLIALDGTKYAALYNQDGMYFAKGTTAKSNNAAFISYERAGSIFKDIVNSGKLMFTMRNKINEYVTERSKLFVIHMNDANKDETRTNINEKLNSVLNDPTSDNGNYDSYDTEKIVNILYDPEKVRKLSAFIGENRDLFYEADSFDGNNETFTELLKLLSRDKITLFSENPYISDEPTIESYITDDDITSFIKNRSIEKKISWNNNYKSGNFADFLNRSFGLSGSYSSSFGENSSYETSSKGITLSKNVNSFCDVNKMITWPLLSNKIVKLIDNDDYYYPDEKANVPDFVLQRSNESRKDEFADALIQGNKVIHLLEKEQSDDAIISDARKPKLSNFRLYVEDKVILKADTQDGKDLIIKDYASMPKEDIASDVLAKFSIERIESAEPEKNTEIANEETTVIDAPVIDAPVNEIPVIEADDKVIEFAKNTNQAKAYKWLKKNVPTILDGTDSWLNYKIGGAFEPLNIEMVDGNILSISHNFIQNGDMMEDPLIELLIDNDAETADVTYYELSNVGIYDSFTNQNSGDEFEIEHNEKQKDAMEYCLKWFKNIDTQGYIQEKYLSIKNGEKITDGNEKHDIQEETNELDIHEDQLDEVQEVKAPEVGDLVKFTDNPDEDIVWRITSYDGFTLSLENSDENSMVHASSRIGFFERDFNKLIYIDEVKKEEYQDAPVNEVSSTENVIQEEVSGTEDVIHEEVSGTENVIQEEVSSTDDVTHREVTKADNVQENVFGADFYDSINIGDYEKEKIAQGSIPYFDKEMDKILEKYNFFISGDNDYCTVSLGTDYVRSFSNKSEGAWFMYKAVEKIQEQLSEHNPKLNSIVLDLTSDTEPDKKIENYRLDDSVGKGTKRERIEKNIAALKVLKNITDGKIPTNAVSDEDKAILAEYSGFGGLSDLFDESKVSEAENRAELKNILTKEEYQSARSTVINAHFTDNGVIRAMYHAVDRLGFKNGKILEPSMGVGKFFGAMPENLRNSQTTGVELDELTGSIAKILYPESDIKICGFEKTKEHDKYDLVIGNVPFGQYGVNDPELDRYKFNIHNYFFAKALKEVRPGGILCLITSRYTLDSKSERAREYISERATLLGAVRLPETAFSETANAEVVSDVVILQKKDEIELDKEEPSWIKTSTTVFPMYERYMSVPIEINNYFKHNEDNMLGEPYCISGPYGRQFTLKAVDGQNLEEKMKQAFDDILPKDIYKVREKEEISLDNFEDDVKYVDCDENIPQFSYGISNGDVYYRESDKMYKPSFRYKESESRVRDMIKLRNIVREIIRYQRDGGGLSGLKDLEKQLDDSYDAFYSKYKKRLNDTVCERDFEGDNGYYLLCSLEEFDSDGEFKEKAAIFTKRTVSMDDEISAVDVPEDALIESIRHRGQIDLKFMKGILNDKFSYEEIIEKLRGLIFLDPEAADPSDITIGWRSSDEYLSGDVVSKLENISDVIETEKNDFIKNIYQSGREYLSKVQPAKLEASDIAVRLGATWVDNRFYSEFVCDILDIVSRKYLYEDCVNYSATAGEFEISDKSSLRSYGSQYGTGRIDAVDIIEASLNLRTVQIRDAVEDPNNPSRPKYVVNQKETLLAQQKQGIIKEKFVSWIWEDMDRRNELVETYNNKFNRTVTRSFNGDFMEDYHPGMNAAIKLKEHQRNAVARILFGGNTLLAHSVGAGKTFEMVAGAMESKRLGLCKKPMIVVPKHLIKQWGHDFMTLYPGANILLSSEKDFIPKNRKKFLARIATGDWDAVIIANTQFEKIPMSENFQREFISNEIQTLKEQLDELNEVRRTNNQKKFSVSRIETRVKQLKKNLIQRQEKINHDKGILTFEEVGVDKLFIDESHYYKNLDITTKMMNVAGLGSGGANKSQDLYMKIKYLDELTDHKGVVFATGTPVTNSMTELYTLMKYLQADKLKELNLEKFDEWASTFGETTTALELAPEGSGFRAKTRFAKFFNLPELMTLFSLCADIKTSDQLDLAIPDVERINVVANPSDEQRRYMKELVDRASRVHNHLVDPSEDNMLKITSDGKKIGLDARLMNDLMPDNPNSKINMCVNNVYDIWETNKEKRLTQLIFCDMSVPKNDGNFNIYDDIRNKLILKGIPKEEIKFIHEANTDIQKRTLMNDVTNGKVRILMGSTEKMGAGMNVQKNLVAEHHLDAPWRPADIEQREGRIIRQGNDCPNVKVFTYVTKETFDAYLFQTLLIKQKFVSQIMTSKSPSRETEDMDDVTMNYASIMAVTAGSPEVREKLQLDNDVSTLKTLKSAWLSEHIRLENAIKHDLPVKIESYKMNISDNEADLITVQEHPVKLDEDGDECFSEIMLNDKTYTDHDEAEEVLKKIVQTSDKGRYSKIGEYRGFELQLGYDFFSSEFQVVAKGKSSHSVELGKTFNGTIKRLNRVLSVELIGERIDLFNEKVNSSEELLKAKTVAFNKPFERENELQQKMERLIELNAKLAMSDASNEKVENNESEHSSAKEKDEKGEWVYGYTISCSNIGGNPDADGEYDGIEYFSQDEAEKVAKDAKNTYDDGTIFHVTKEEHYIAPGESKDDILRNMKMPSEELKPEQKSSMGIQECAFTK